jgi:hypothetical protein
MSVAGAVYPVTRRFIGLAKEAVFGTVVAPSFTHAMTKFTPKDNITYLKDTAWRNAMAELYNMVPGVGIADLDMEGPFFGDAAGYDLACILGDYWQSVNGTSGTPTTVGATPYAAGGTTLNVTSGTNLPNNAVFAVGALGTTAEEVRTVISGGGTTTITLSAPMYQAHAAGVAVTPYTAVTTYVHNFSLLNSGAGMGGFLQAQPPSYTYTDYTGVTATSGARNYAATCLADLSFTGTATSLLLWAGKGMGFASQVAGSTPVATISAIKPQASWQSTLSIAGTQVNTVEEWKVNMTRKLDPKFTNSGQQTPFAIPRGELGVTVDLMHSPAVDESQFLYYLNNTQPTLAITAGNGLSGASLCQLVLSMQVAAHDTGQLEDSKTTFGYNMTVAAVANSTNAGPSGGVSPLQVALTNAIVSY